MPRIVDHEAQRERLAEHGFRLFAERGYPATSMRALARAAGVSTGTLYHYFPDKAAILDHLLSTVVDRDALRVRDLMPADASRPARVRAVLAFVRANEDELRKLLRVIGEVFRHEPSDDARARLKEAFARYRSETAAVLDLPDGGAVRIVFSLLVGALVHRELDPGGVSFDAIEAQVLALLAAERPRAGGC